MAYDLSTEVAAEPTSVSFEDFCEHDAPQVGVALGLIVAERALAQQAFADALAEASRHWSRLGADRAAAFGHVLRLGIDRARALADKETVDLEEGAELNREAEALDHVISPGDLTLSFGRLPISQSSTLVSSLYLAWPDPATARALGLSVAAVETRRRRALTVIARRHGSTADEVEAELRPLLQDLATDRSLVVPEPRQSRRRGRLTSWRKRSAVGLVVLAFIALVASQLDIARPAERAEPGPEVEPTVEPPRTSSKWYGPVGDGSGDFIALNTTRGALFSRSVDGDTWYRESLWNSGAIDIRSVITSFRQSGGQYVTTIEANVLGPGIVAPRVALSRDLVTWEVLEVDLGPLPDEAGLVPQAEVLGVAVAGERVLVAVRIDATIDYRREGLRQADVCVVADDEAGVVLHLCDGTTRTVAPPSRQPGAGFQAETRLLLSEAGGPFQIVEPPAGFSPSTLFSFGGRFGVFDNATGTIAESLDGRAWEGLFDLDNETRLGLASGSLARGVLVVDPQGERWRSHLIVGSDVSDGSIPVGISPNTVWLRPEIASGPAGWAMFVTTSRPWERAGNDEVGWAVDTGAWVVNRLPQRDTIVLQSSDRTVAYRYAPGGEFADASAASTRVERSIFGGVRLRHPVTGEVLVEVTAEQIRSSRGETARVDDSNAAIEVDGWRLTGDLVDGPLRVERPDGGQLVFADGYLFRNRNVDDQVEVTSDGQGQEVLGLHRADGSVEFDIDLRTVQEALGGDDAGGAQTRAAVVFSPDGVDWEVIWETSEETWYGSVAVGDREVLLSSAELTGGPIRLPIEE